MQGESDLPPSYSASIHDVRNRRPRRESHQESRPQAPEVERQLECPYAARLFMIHNPGIASRCAVASRILGLPPAVGFQYNSAEAADPSTAASSGAADSLRMYTCPIWRDSSLVEVSFAALRHVRAEVDMAFDGRRSTVLGVTNEEEGSAEASVHTGRARGAVVGGVQRSPLPVYEIEWFMGTVTLEGKAGVQTLGAVDLHQVVPGETQTMFPVRRQDGVHYNSLLMDLSYRLGDPLLFSCTRRR